MDEINLGTAPLAEVVAWGNPWHGPIVDTTLTLPDSSTRTVPAPEHNAVFDFHVPGAPGGGGAPVPAGGEWRDYLLLYGDCRHVYGNEIAATAVNWLYASPDGSRWLVSVTSAVSGIALSSAALTINLSAKRFGEFGGTPETVNFSVTLANRGLGETLDADITGSIPSTVGIGISDLLPDGSKAVLMFQAPISASSGELNGQQFPLGFFEISLNSSSFPASTATLLYNIAQVAGTREAGTYIYSGGFAVGETGYATATAASSSVTNAIMAVWYTGAGAAAPVYFNYHQPLESSTWVNVGDGSGTESHSASLTATYGGGSWAAYTYAASLAYSGSDGSETLDIALTDNDGTIWTVDVNKTPGTDGNKSGTRNRTLQSWLGISATPPDIGYEALSFGVTAYTPWATSLLPLDGANGLIAFYDPEIYKAALVYCKRASARLFLICRTWIDHDTGARKTIIDKALTPGGLIEVGYAVPDDTLQRNLSAAWQPVTGDINIGSDGEVRAWV